MQEEGHDPYSLPWSKGGEREGCTLPLATLCGREQQGLVKDAAGMSGCRFGYHPELWL